MIKDSLLKEIEEFCRVNEITDTEGLINKMLSRGFSIEKFGETPAGAKEKEIVEKIIEKEVEVEKIVEVIKEVPVEKIVKVSDDAKMDELLAQISELEIKLKEAEKEHANNAKKQTQAILKLNKEKDEITEHYEKIIEEMLQTNNNEEKDIYGESMGDEDRPKGFFDIKKLRWPNKNKQ